MDDINIFSTPLLDGISIKEYKGLVIVRNVRAMSIVYDWLTRIRDIFGGRSGSYQNIMKTMEEEVLAEARENARKQGGNAIIDFKLDFDGIEGLVMATGQGMAVVI